jgi:hypothetical protein
MCNHDSYRDDIAVRFTAILAIQESLCFIRKNPTARSSTFNFARTLQNQKSFHFPTTTQINNSNICQ